MALGDADICVGAPCGEVDTSSTRPESCDGVEDAAVFGTSADPAAVCDASRPDVVAAGDVPLVALSGGCTDSEETAD